MLDGNAYLNDINPDSIPKNSIESNSRIIEWSDGTMSLAIGSGLFDIRIEEMNNSDVYVKYEAEMALLKSQVN